MKEDKRQENYMRIFRALLAASADPLKYSIYGGYPRSAALSRGAKSPEDKKAIHLLLDHCKLASLSEEKMMG